jgi:membrane associated rhomboid family serine protease
MMLGACLPWQIIRVDGLLPELVSSLESYGMVTLLMGAVALIAASLMLKRDTRIARLLVLVASLIAGAVGGYALYRMPDDRIVTLGPGLYVVGIGVLLAIVGSFLQRAAPAPRLGQ